jgi:hypothetical protein
MQEDDLEARAGVAVPPRGESWGIAEGHTALS